MATYQCPKGHASTDPDYCSECGALIGPSTVPVPAVKPAATASSANADVCPDCMTPRTPGARFCEVCRYDFTAGTHSAQTPTPAATPDSQAAVATPVEAPPAQPPSGDAQSAKATTTGSTAAPVTA